MTMISHSQHRPTDDSSSTERDRGAVLPLVLVMIVIGSLVVLPVMSYATTVLRANSVLSAKTQRYEAVKAGLRTALYDPLDLYRKCDQSQVARVHYSSTDMNGVEVDTSCQLVGFAKTVINDHLRYGLTATEAGQTIPAALKGKKYAAPVGNPSDWVPKTRTALQDDPNGSEADTIWLPDLPSYALITRTRLQGYDMPVAYNKEGQTCKVYFPGKYVGDIVLTGPTFFTSGIYYFEGRVRIEGGANVVVGDGRYQGCTTSQEAVFFAEPTLTQTEPHSITGFGATWIFGDDGRMVVSNDNGRKLDLVFNRRYVDDRASDPSLYVSIASVNGAMSGAGVYEGYKEPGFVDVPQSYVQVGKKPDGTAIRESPIAHQMIPSSLTDVARVPAVPVQNPVVTYRTSVVATNTTNGAAYVTWQRLPDTSWGGLVPDRYQVFVDDSTTPACTVAANAVYLECIVSNVQVNTTDTPHHFHVRAVNAAGLSPLVLPVTTPGPGTKSAVYKNGLLGVIGATPAHATTPAPGVPTVAKHSSALRVTWTPPTLSSPTTPITHYTLTGQYRTSPVGTPTNMTSTCSVALTTQARGASSCRITGLSSSREYRFQVTATTLNGSTSAVSDWSVWTAADGSGGGTADALAPTPTALPTMPPLFTDPIVDIDVSYTNASNPASIRIPGYIAVPQGTVSIKNPTSHNLQFKGGMLAARFNVTDGRTASQGCTTAPNPLPTGWASGVNCIDLGFESEVVQMRFRIVSTTPSGKEQSVAVVQINENGAYAVNSWEVQ